MTIVISPAQLQIIYYHAENNYPEECCGVLVGKIDLTNKIIIEVIPTTNTWVKPDLVTDLDPVDELTKTKHSRYTISPQDTFKAQKKSRDLNLEIIGFFHSHPDYPAIPSMCDRSQAWEIYSYPIVSVISGKVSDIKSWVLGGDGVFQAEEIQVRI